MSRIAASPRALAVLALLGALLGASAPLAHAHLDAAGLVASGLCGEQHAGDGGDASEPCSLCLAGAQARTAVKAGAAAPAPGQVAAPSAASAAPERPLEPRLAATRPRAPPRA